SIILSAFAFGGTVFGLSQFGGGESGAGASAGTGLAWASIAGGLVFLGLFVWRQLVLIRADRALLDLRVFTSRNYVLSVI
ncbi:UNVERIFIED_CONTAM: MFS transporter, partial [Salmonella enterica subsp. enterica serovar Weltevreden]